MDGIVLSVPSVSAYIQSVGRRRVDDDRRRSDRFVSERRVLTKRKLDQFFNSHSAYKIEVTRNKVDTA